MSAEDFIRVGCLGSVAWVRIEGTANYENAGCIRDFLYGRFERGWRTFVIDLGKCRGIDSTFIGMLSSLAMKIAKLGEEGNVEVINPSERNANSIHKLGLGDYIHLDLEGKRWERERALVDENLAKPACEPVCDRIKRAELVLEAHEVLIAANEENRGRFRDVVEFLRQELEAETARK